MAAQGIEGCLPPTNRSHDVAVLSDERDAASQVTNDPVGQLDARQHAEGTWRTGSHGLGCQALLVGTGKRAEPRAFCMARSTEPSMQPGGLTWSTRLACLGEVEARNTTCHTYLSRMATHRGTLISALFSLTILSSSMP